MICSIVIRAGSLANSIPARIKTKFGTRYHFVDGWICNLIVMRFDSDVKTFLDWGFDYLK